MASKRPYSSSPLPCLPNKRKRTSLTLKLKLEILNRVEAGEGASHLGRVYNLGESTIRNIKKNAEKIRSAVVHSSPLCAKVTTKVRNPIIEKMEKMLLIYIEHENKKKSPMSSSSVRSTALKFYAHLCEEANSNEIEPFIASTGWFAKFIKRHNLHNLKSRGEGGSADHQAAAQYPAEFKLIIEGGGYSPQQVFNANEKRMPTNRPAFGELQMTANRNIKDSGDNTMEFSSVKQGQCEAYPEPAQDPQESNELNTKIGSIIEDGGSVSEEAEFPMVLQTPIASPSPAPDSSQPKQIRMQHRNHFTNVMEALACDEAFVDVTLTAEGHAIRAHKLVLSAISPYFQQVLCNNPCSHPVIIMPYHVQFDHLTHLVEYMYKGEVTIAEDQVESLLKTAKLLQINGLTISDPETLSTENPILSAALQTNYQPTRSSTNDQSCCSGGTVPLTGTSKVTVDEIDSLKVSKPLYSSPISVRPLTALIRTPSKNATAQVDSCKMAKTVISRAAESRAVSGSSSNSTGKSDVPVNINTIVSGESVITDNPLLEALSDIEIDIKEEKVLIEEENGERVRFDLSPQKESRHDPLSTSQKPNISHSAKPNSRTLPVNTGIRTPDPFICPYCKEQHIDVKKMKVHLTRKHPFKPRSVCGCGRVFVRPTPYQTHKKLCSSSS